MFDSLCPGDKLEYDSVFNKLQDFQDICNLVGQPKHDYQLVNMAYIIFQKVPNFHDSLIRWNRKQDDIFFQG